MALEKTIEFTERRAGHEKFKTRRFMWITASGKWLPRFDVKTTNFTVPEIESINYYFNRTVSQIKLIYFKFIAGTRCLPLP